MLFTLIGKNLKQLIRSKTSSLIILLGPLLIITLLGFAFNNSDQYALNIGVFSEQYSETSNGFIQSLEAENYVITKLNSEVDCISAVKDTSLHACIIFPPNLKIDPNNKPEIQFYLDSSNENLAFNIINTITHRLGEENKEISKQLIDNMVTTINNVDSSVNNIKTQLQDVNANLDKIDESSETISDSLDSMSLDYTPTDTSNITDIIDWFEDLESSTETTIENIEDAMDDLEDLTPEISNSSLRSEINDIIDDVLDDLNETQAVLDDNSSSSDVTGAISQIVNDVDNLNTKLNQANVASQTISTEISSIQTSLTSSTQTLDNVLIELGDIETSIDSLKVKNPELLSTPFDIKINYEQPNHFSSMFAGMIIIVIMFISLLLSTQLIISDRNSPAYFRNMISPLNSFVYICAMYITNLLITTLQVAIMLGVAIGYFKLSFELPYIILVLFIATTIFSFLGMIIGYFFNSEETATIAAISTSAVLMFLSDLIIPIESIPRFLLEYIKYNPVYRFKTIINMFNNNNPLIVLQSLQYEFYTYLGVVIGLFIITMIFAYISKKNIFKFLHKKHHKKDKKLISNQKSKEPIKEEPKSEKKTTKKKNKKKKKKTKQKKK